MLTHLRGLPARTVSWKEAPTRQQRMAVNINPSDRKVDCWGEIVWALFILAVWGGFVGTVTSMFITSFVTEPAERAIVAVVTGAVYSLSSMVCIWYCRLVALGYRILKCGYAVIYRDHADRQVLDELRRIDQATYVQVNEYTGIVNSLSKGGRRFFS